MGILRRFNGYRPPGRVAGGPKWVQLRIYESALSSGPWGEGQAVPIDTQPIADYPDPTSPPALTFETSQAVIANAWYVVEYVGSDGATALTVPEAANGLDVFLPPSAGEVRERSKLLQLRLPLSDPPDPEVEEELRQVVYDATVLVQSLTGRTLDESLTGDLPRLGMMAVRMKSEQLSEGTYSARARRSAMSRANLRSISAGPWSESYFGPADAAKAQVLDPDPRLHEVLWALATEERREEWIALWRGEYQPMGVAQEFNWFPEARGGY